MNPSGIKQVISSAICVMLLAALVSCKTQETKTGKNPVEVKQTSKLDIAWKDSNSKQLTCYDAVTTDEKQVAYLDIVIGNDSDQTKTCELGSKSLPNCTFQDGKRTKTIKPKSKNIERVAIPRDDVKNDIYRFTLNLLEDKKTEHALTLDINNRWLWDCGLNKHMPVHVYDDGSFRREIETDYLKNSKPYNTLEFRVDNIPESADVKIDDYQPGDWSDKHFSLSFDFTQSSPGNLYYFKLSTKQPNNLPEYLDLNFIPVNTPYKLLFPMKSRVYLEKETAKPNAINKNLIKWSFRDDMMYAPGDFTFAKIGKYFIAKRVGLQEATKFFIYTADEGVQLWPNYLLFNARILSEKLLLFNDYDNLFLVTPEGIKIVKNPVPNYNKFKVFQLGNRLLFVETSLHATNNYCYMDLETLKINEKGTFKSNIFWKNEKNYSDDEFVIGDKCYFSGVEWNSKHIPVNLLLACFDLKKGNQLWSRKIPNPDAKSFDTDHPPQLVDGFPNLIFSNKIPSGKGIVECTYDSNVIGTIYLRMSVDIANGKTTILEQRTIKEWVDHIKEPWRYNDCENAYGHNCIRNNKKEFMGLVFEQTIDGLFAVSVKTGKRYLLKKTEPDNNEPEQSDEVSFDGTTLLIDNGKTLLVFFNSTYALDVSLLEDLVAKNR